MPFMTLYDLHSGSGNKIEAKRKEEGGRRNFFSNVDYEIPMFRSSILYAVSDTYNKTAKNC